MITNNRQEAEELKNISDLCMDYFCKVYNKINYAARVSDGRKYRR